MQPIVYSRTKGVDSNGETKTFYFVYEDSATKEQLALATFYSNEIFTLSSLGLKPFDFPFIGKEAFISISKLDTSLTTFTNKELDTHSISDEEISSFVKDLSQSQKEILLFPPYALNSSYLGDYIDKKIMILKENFGWGPVSPFDVGRVSSHESINFSGFKDWGIRGGEPNAFVPLDNLFEFMSIQKIYNLRRTLEINESMLLKDSPEFPPGKLLVTKNTVRGVEDNG